MLPLHGPDASKRKAKLRLDTRKGAFKDIGDGWWIVKPGEPNRSELVRRIHSELEDDMMSPADSHLSLSGAEKAPLKRWVEEGADYMPHCSLVPVHTPNVPKPRVGVLAANSHGDERLAGKGASQEILGERIFEVCFDGAA